ncbi:MAG: ParA family protein [Acidobacteriota bacterium]
MAKKTLAVASNKGGVGKTTIAINVASIWGSSSKVLLVDLDPQRNSTMGVGLKSTPENTVAEVLQGKCKASDAIVSTGFGSLSIMPSSVRLASLETEDLKLNKLADALTSVEHKYDTIVIDCPPSLGRLTINGLVASDRLLVPVKPGLFSLAGLQQVFGLVDALKNNRMNRNLKVLGLVYNEAPLRTNAFKLIDADLRDSYGKMLLSSFIPSNIKIVESQMQGKPINHYDTNSTGYLAFSVLAAELLRKW